MSYEAPEGPDICTDKKTSDSGGSFGGHAHCEQSHLHFGVCLFHGAVCRGVCHRRPALRASGVPPVVSRFAPSSSLSFVFYIWAALALPTGTALAVEGGEDFPSHKFMQSGIFFSNFLLIPGWRINFKCKPVKSLTHPEGKEPSRI